MLTALRKGASYKVYPANLNHRMEDYVFVKIVEMEETNNNKNNINFDNCNFETIHFYKEGIAEHNDVPITKDYSNMIRETLQGYPLAEKWNTKSKSLVLYQTICNSQAISS